MNVGGRFNAIASFAFLALFTPKVDAQIIVYDSDHSIGFDKPLAELIS